MVTGRSMAVAGIAAAIVRTADTRPLFMKCISVIYSDVEVYKRNDKVNDFFINFVT